MTQSIDIEELAVEAKANLVESQELAGSITVNPLMLNATVELLEMSPLFVLVGLDPILLESIRTLNMWFWEMGRLYGRAEIVRETVGE